MNESIFAKRSSLSKPKITPSEIRARNHIHRRVMHIKVISDMLLSSMRESLVRYSSSLLDRNSVQTSPICMNHMDKYNTIKSKSILMSQATEQKSTKFVGLTVDSVLRDYSDCLSSSEANELLSYKIVYYIRRNDLKYIDCYTNSDGDYTVLEGDQIDFRYEILNFIASGSFGSVVKCLDHKTNHEVAIKILKKTPFSQKQAVNEYKIAHLLTHDIKENHCIVKIKRKFDFRTHSCFVFELLGLSLSDFISNNNYQPISLSLVKRLTVQILRGLCHIHSLQIIHCDLKPENILFKHASKSLIKIIDFGTSCFTNSKTFTYIQSRFYRSPEIALQCGFDQSIDIWSLGCIIVELLTGVPLFPANSEKELVYSIAEVLGMPPKALVSKSRAKLRFNFKSASTGTRPLNRILAGYNPEVIEFVEKCLKWNPAERITAKDGMKAKWIKGTH